jgi:hypothetical protein
MPGSTPLGIPYPVGSDRVADGDNAIESLARWVDSSITWGFVTLSGGAGPGVGGSMWFTTCGSFAGSPGVSGTANGITVPRKGFYLVTATGQMSWSQPGTNNAALFIGDGFSVWARSYVNMTVVGAIQHSVYCQSVVSLPAGTMVRWGMACTGPGAAGMAGGAADSNLVVSLLHPVP